MWSCWKRTNVGPHGDKYKYWPVVPCLEKGKNYVVHCAYALCSGDCAVRFSQVGARPQHLLLSFNLNAAVLLCKPTSRDGFSSSKVLPPPLWRFALNFTEQYSCIVSGTVFLAPCKVVPPFNPSPLLLLAFHSFWQGFNNSQITRGTRTAQGHLHSWRFWFCWL